MSAATDLAVLLLLAAVLILAACLALLEETQP